MKPATFISHKNVDSQDATSIKRRLEYHHEIKCYLDVFDEHIQNGPQLADYIKNKLHDCNNLIVVISGETKTSWWVPWEIGIASEREYPLATFAIQNTDLPSYLKKWPYLRDMYDLDKYARAVKGALFGLTGINFLAENINARKSASQNFFSTLRSQLSQ